jgi:glycosyltransferase involved in cell wall biosynthesis
LNPKDECVLVIAGYAPSLTNFRAPLLRAIRATGRRVIAAAPHLLDDPATVAALERLGVECRDLPLSRTGINPLADLRFMRSMVALMRAESPDVVLAYTAKPVIYGLMAAKIAGVARRYALITGLGYAFAENGTRKTWLIREIQKRLYRRALRRATKVFFQNSDDPELFRALNLIPSKLPVIVVNGSGIDLEHFSSAPLPEGPLRFLLIARLIAGKGIREFAKAAEQIRRDRANIEFHLVGGLDTNPDGLSETELRGWQKAGTLIWHGEVKDVRPHIEACHVYVLPSYYREGVPRSILEALAIGRAIITTDAPGCRETVIEGENGFLVPPRNPASLAEAMGCFVADPDLAKAMGKRSRELAETKFDVNKVNAQMMREMEMA